MIRERFAPLLRQRGVGLVGCVVVFVLVLSAGLIGTQATGAVVRLQDGGAWLSNLAQGTTTWVNGYAGQAGKTVPVGKLSSPFQVVQRPDGAYAIDENGKATLIDGARLEASKKPQQLPSGVQILANQAATWILDDTKQQVQRLDPASLAPLGDAVPVEGLTRAVVDDEGYLWAAVPAEGVVVRIGEGATGRTEVGRAGETLTVAADEQGERVIAVNTTAGSTFSLHGDAPARSFPPLPAGSGEAGLQVGVGHDGRLLIGLDGRAVVVPAEGEGRSAALPKGTKVDQVEIVSGIGYVVDRSSQNLIKVDLGSGTGEAVANVGGDELRDVVSHGNLLYLNDSGGNQVKVVKPDGTVVPIEKYRPGQKPNANSPKTPPTQSPKTPDEPQRNPENKDEKSPQNRDDEKKNQNDKKDQKNQDQEPKNDAENPDPGQDAPVEEVDPVENEAEPPIEQPADPDQDPEEPGVPVEEPVEPPADEPVEEEPEPEAPPEAPVIANVTAEDGEALIEWQAALDRGSEITGYAIVVDNQTVVEVAAGERNYIVNDLTNGRQYGIQVRALSAAGEGDLSQVRYVTPSADLPGAPGGVTAEAGDASIKVNWTAAQAGRSQVTGYTVTAVTTGGGRTTVQATGVTATVPGLTNGTGYTIEVTATSAGGTGEVATPGAGQPGSATNPAVPSGVPGQVTVAAPKVTGNAADITWTAAPNGGSAITRYDVQVGTGQVQNVGTQLKYTAKDLAAGQDTQIKVRAVNKNGNGPWTTVKARPAELARKQMYQCQSHEVDDIHMLNLDNDCNNDIAQRWNTGKAAFKALSTQQPGTVQLTRCVYREARGLIRRQINNCAGDDNNAGVAFWAWTTANANGTEIREYRYPSGGYYYAPAGQGAPSGFASTGRSFWT